jgi:hypothetical protein
MVTMDARDNPFIPSAGARPPELAGRGDLTDAFEVLLDRLADGRHGRSVIIRGLRGVGKTVLLNAFADMATERRWPSIKIEVTGGLSVASELLFELRSVLLAQKPTRLVREQLNRALGSLKSFSLTLPDGSSVRLDVQPLAGRADSGNLSRDLTHLFEDVGDVLRKLGAGVVILLDEAHLLDKDEYEALIRALHEMSQQNLPIVLVAAGLPQLPELSRTAKTYAERLFEYREIGALDRMAAHAALVIPVAAAGITFDEAAIRHIIRRTQGYPYFIQEFGKAAWLVASGQTITLADARVADAEATRLLDAGFFRARLAVASSAERQYLRAMASLGPGPHRSADIANRYKGSSGEPRAALIRKGLLYSPEYGQTAFTVPLFDEFIGRHFGEPAHSGNA